MNMKPRLTDRVLRGLDALIGNEVLTKLAADQIDSEAALLSGHATKESISDVAGAVRWLDAMRAYRRRSKSAPTRA